MRAWHGLITEQVDKQTYINFKSSKSTKTISNDAAIVKIEDVRHQLLGSYLIV